MGKIIIGLTDHTQKEDPKMEEQEEQGKKESTVLPEPTEITVKNPRIGKVRKLEEEVKRQNELEQLRTRRIRKEQEYIEQMSKAVEDHLRNTREEQRYNEEFERLIRKDVYQMHGISEDKLQGMTEYRYALYRGTAFGMFFLSLILTGICGYLHGFGSELCIFMAFYTAIEGTLLNNGKRQHAILDVLTRILYLLLFPAMLIVFVCYELGFTEYALIVPALTIAGVVLLLLGAVSYFLYDPYRLDRKNHKKANRYIRDIEKAAIKEVELEEKALAKQAKKQEKLELKEEARQKRAAKRRERKKQIKEIFSGWKESIREKLPKKKFFLSLILTGICGYLHGFGSELCIFMAFYTAIEGTLLNNGKRQHAILDVLTRILYLLLFPAMLIVFVCYELGFTEYALIVPALTIAGVVLLLLGAVSYFLYDPYRLDRKNHKKANRYIRDIEKAAIKEVELEEKALAKQAKKQEKLELKEEARQKRAAKRRERKKQIKEIFSGWKESIREKLPKKKQEPPEILEDTKTSTAADPMGDTETSEQTEQTDAVEMTVTEGEQTEKSVDTEGSGTTSMEEA